MTTMTTTTVMTMTKRKPQRWLPALLVAPVAAGLFGATASWALVNDPQPKQAAAAQQAASQSTETSTLFGAGVSPELDLAAEQNQTTIAQLETKLAEAQARLESLRASTSALQAGGASGGSSASAQQTWVAPSPSAPVAPQPAPRPAPQTNSSTGAS